MQISNEFSPRLQSQTPAKRRYMRDAHVASFLDFLSEILLIKPYNLYNKKRYNI